MPRRDRAKQFAPFDALKGLREALHLKEYEHERVLKGDLQPEQIESISKTLLNLNKDDVVEIKYYYDGHYKTIVGKARVDIFNQEIKVNNTKISFDNIFELSPQ